jgi:hypothetical protein
MSREEMNPIEYQQQTGLADLKKEYADLKKTEAVLLANQNKAGAEKMDKQANAIAVEIMKLDPNFGKNLDTIVKENFEAESEELNASQHRKPYVKKMN